MYVIAGCWLLKQQCAYHVIQNLKSITNHFKGSSPPIIKDARLVFAVSQARPDMHFAVEKWSAHLALRFIGNFQAFYFTLFFLVYYSANKKYENGCAVNNGEDYSLNILACIIKMCDQRIWCDAWHFSSNF